MSTTPFAIPIFDTPFALVAIGVGYLCLERHRLRQDLESAAIGVTLWLTALLAFAHILAQPDYPANPGVNPGIAPYYFFYAHRFAAQAIEFLPEAERAGYRAKLYSLLWHVREEDGGWNDRVFPRSENFGTAMTLFALNEPVAARPAGWPVMTKETGGK